MLDNEMMHNKQTLRELQLMSGEKLAMFGSEEQTYDLQLSVSPRAAAVRAESLRLMEQLQQSLREQKNAKKMGKKRAIESGEASPTDFDPNSIDSEQGSAGCTPRPSQVEDAENPYPLRLSVI